MKGIRKMDENQIIAATIQILKLDGYSICSSCSTTQRGVDIIAEKSDTTVLVEAKGGTSSRSKSSRFGKPYTQSQVFDRVAKGVFTCLQLRSKHRNIKDRVILSVPKSEWYLRYLDEVLRRDLFTAGVEVLFIDLD